jgi:fatty-acyl-CoA synthase
MLPDPLLGSLSPVTAGTRNGMPNSLLTPTRGWSPALVEFYARRDVVLQQSWGLTGTAPFAAHLPAEHTLDKLGSAGIAVPYTEVRVVDAVTNEPVKPREPGEIVVRGPNVTAG